TCALPISLLRTDVDFSVTQKEDAVHITQTRAAAGGRAVCLERGVCDDVRIGPNESIPKSRLVTEALHDCQGVRREVVLRDAISRIRPGEQNLSLCRLCPSSSPSSPATTLPFRLAARAGCLY